VRGLFLAELADFGRKREKRRKISEKPGRKKSGPKPAESAATLS
jgi:hypothetical protein